MTRHVVDASVVIKWFLEEVHANAARRLQEDRYELFAPDLLWPESGNILWKKVQRGELSRDDARLIRKALEKQPLEIFASLLVIEAALELAMDTGCTVYDTCYLALAMLTGSRLVTADERLFNSLQDGPYVKHLLWVEDVS